MNLSLKQVTAGMVITNRFPETKLVFIWFSEISKQEIKILDEKDVENYTIYDIALPLPGFDVKYPENEVKEWYKEILEGYGLSLEMHKQKVK